MLDPKQKMYPETRLLEKAAGVLRSGGVVIVPTETFYALAADPFQEEPVRRIFKLKGRTEEKPLPLIAADRDLVMKVIARPSDLALELMNRFWPGSLTIVLQPARPLSRLVSAADGKIGVRVPPPCAARTLARMAGGWITATSANISGDPDPEQISRIAEPVRNAVDFIVDLGPSPGGKPSTVLEPLDNAVRLIREGALPMDALKDLVPEPFDGESS